MCDQKTKMTSSNSQNYESVHAHSCKQYMLYKSHSTWEYSHVDLQHTPPSSVHALVQPYMAMQNTYLSLQYKNEKENIF